MFRVGRPLTECIVPEYHDETCRNGTGGPGKDPCCEGNFWYLITSFGFRKGTQL